MKKYIYKIQKIKSIINRVEELKFMYIYQDLEQLYYEEEEYQKYYP